MAIIPGVKLRDLGVNAKALQKFKAILMSELKARGSAIPAGKLQFSEDVSVSAVALLVQKRLSEAESLMQQTNRGRTAAPRPPAAKPVLRGGVASPKKAARKAARKPAAKPGAGAFRHLNPGPIGRFLQDLPPVLPMSGTAAGGPPRRMFIPAPPPAPGDGFVPRRPQRALSRVKPTLAPGPIATRKVECMPQLEIAAELEKGTLYGLEVSLDQGPAAPGADVRTSEFDVPEDLTEFAVDVWFDCSAGLTLENVPDKPQVTVQSASGLSDHLAIQMRVDASLHDGAQPLFVSAFFRYNGRPSGKITRFLEQRRGNWSFKGAVPAAPSAPAGEVMLPKSASAPAAVIDTQAQPADIHVEVLTTPDNDGRHFTLRCVRGDSTWQGAWTTPQVTRDLVAAYMQQVITAPVAARVNRLRDAGMQFWDVLPKPVRDLLLTAIEAGAISLSIVSEEPYIPWELMVPYRRVTEKRAPLGVALRLGRWVTADYVSPTQAISMRSIHIICPTSSGLTSSSSEADMLRRVVSQPNSLVQPASYAGVDKALGAEKRDIVHFICHGKSATLQTLQLEYPDTLNCSEVRSMDGFQAAFQGGTFAFLNACEVGSQVLTLDGVGGFANSFIELGASAVVAPLWPVQDAAALDVATQFYSEALTGTPLAEIMKNIRAKAYQQGIDSYAAYCFYGDPNAAVQGTSPSSRK